MLWFGITFETSNFDLVVNSTSAGLKDEYLSASKEILEPVLKMPLLLFDCIYGKITPFFNI